MGQIVEVLHHALTADQVLLSGVGDVAAAHIAIVLANSRENALERNSPGVQLERVQSDLIGAQVSTE